MADPGRGRSIATCAVSILLATLFLAAGGMKLAGAQEVVDTFTRYGYAGWFRVLTGLMEVTGAVMLLVPRWAFSGATLLGVVMIGAAHTHLTHGEVPNALFPLILLIVLGFLGYARSRA
jgi:putative oxidoreductase